MIERILPGRTAAAEAFGDLPDARLWPAERAVIDKAMPGRRREFATVRHCARTALAELGYRPVSILPGPAREPRWPVGVVGSMTHCRGYRAAALAHRGDLASLGIDAEPHEPLPGGVLRLIARPEEISMLASLSTTRPQIRWDRLVFSAKESVYKAWYPLTRCWLGFEDVTLIISERSRSFEAVLHRPGPVVGMVPLTRLSGRWLVDDGLIVTSVVVPGEHPAGQVPV